MNTEAQYLGDGVYASRNQWGQIVLTTGHHEEARADNVIFLEPEVAEALVAYVAKTQPI